MNSSARGPGFYFCRSLAILLQLFAGFHAIGVGMVRIDNDTDRQIVAQSCWIIIILFPLIPFLWHEAEPNSHQTWRRPALVMFLIACFMVANRWQGERSRIKNTFTPPSPPSNRQPLSH